MFQKIQVISLEDNQDLVDSLCHADSVDEINGEIDRGLLLKTLTPKEKEIVLLLEQGFNQPEIAEKLKVNQSTICRIIGKLRHKLDKKLL